MDKNELHTAWQHCIRNRHEIENSQLCGCFYCLNVFPAHLILRWVDVGEQTAICPICSIDSVIGDASEIMLTDEFLEEMHDNYFT